MNEIGNQINQLPVSLGGRFVYQFLGYRKSIVMSNIENVYGDKLTQAQKVHLAKAFYSHLLTFGKEMVMMRFIGERGLKKRVEVKGHERLLEVAKAGKGVLILTGHFGNWEFAPLGGILNFKQFQGQFHFIRRSLGIKGLEKILFRRYYRAGLNVIQKDQALQHVSEALENNHAVVFVLDQHADLHTKDGIPVEFFGKKAGTFRSLASLARHTGVPVVPAAGYRLKNGKHVLEFFDPIPWKEYPTTSESIYQNTLSYNQAIERIILAHPEQWLWLHRRWKNK